MRMINLFKSFVIFNFFFSKVDKSGQIVDN